MIIEIKNYYETPVDYAYSICSKLFINTKHIQEMKQISIADQDRTDYQIVLSNRSINIDEKQFLKILYIMKKEGEK